MITEAAQLPNTPVAEEAFFSLDLLPDERLVFLAQVRHPGAADLLVCRYRKRVQTLANRYFLRGAEREDVIQEGMIGLSRAIRRHGNRHSLPFAHFAEICIRRQIQSAVRAACRQKHLTLNLALGQNSYDCEEYGLGSQRQWRPSTVSNKVADDLFDRCMNAAGILTSLEKAVIDGFVDGESQSEISQRLRCDLKAIDNALQRAKRKLRAL